MTDLCLFCGLRPQRGVTLFVSPLISRSGIADYPGICSLCVAFLVRHVVADNMRLNLEQDLSWLNHLRHGGQDGN